MQVVPLDTRVIPQLSDFFLFNLNYSLCASVFVSITRCACLCIYVHEARGSWVHTAWRSDEGGALQPLTDPGKQQRTRILSDLRAEACLCANTRLITLSVCVFRSF